MAKSIDPKIAKELMEAIVKHDSAHAFELIRTHSARELFCDDKFTTSGKTPLHHAISENNAEVALALINKEGANANMAFKKTSGVWGLSTPLHEAVHIIINKDGQKEITANKAIVEALVNMKGVNSGHLSSKDNHGKTASAMAREAHFNDIAVIIEENLAEKLKAKPEEQTPHVQTAMPASQIQQQLYH